MTRQSYSDGTIGIKYTEKDFSDLRQMFFDITGVQMPEWTDQTDYDPGVTIANYCARLGALLSFYIDRRAEENYPDTARLMASIRRMGKLVGYTPNPSATASVPIIVTTNAAGIIPALFSVSSEGTSAVPSITYELLEDYLVASAGTYTITFYQGTTRQNVVLGTSDGTPFQTYTLVESSVATNANGDVDVSVEVYDGANWTRWTRVPSVFNCLAAATVYQTEYKENGQVTIQFGDGVTGKIPPIGSSQNIRATYRVGGGSIGSKPGRGTISTISNAQGCTIVTSVINAVQPSGGADSTILSDAKRNIKLASANMDDKVISFSDAESCILNSGLGVSRVKVRSERNPYDIKVVLSMGSSSPTPTGYWDSFSKSGSGTIGSVGSYLTGKCSESWILDIQPAVAVPIISKYTITLRKSAYRKAADSAIKNLISSYIINDSDFDSVAKVNEVIGLIEDLDYVSDIEVTEFRRSPRAEFVQGLDRVTFSGYSVSAGVDEEEWTIHFIDNSRFIVLGSKSGEQSSVGVLTGKQFTTNKGTLAFTANLINNSYLPSAGTRYTMKTSKFIGNVAVSGKEILTQGSTLIKLIGGLT